MPHTPRFPTADLMPQVHLCLQHRPGDPAAALQIDIAQALREDLQALGLPLSWARRRLRADAVNLIIGIDQGFDAAAAQGHCVLLLQHLPRPQALPATALRLLQRLPSVNLAPPPGAPAEAPLSATWMPGCGPARGLGQANPDGIRAIDQRPIALLMAERPTPRQAAVLAGMAQAGIPVARLEQALCGPERAAMLGQARALLCLLADDGAAADAMALALALRQGTPVLAERPANGQLPDWPPAGAVMWFDPTPAGLAEALCGGADQPAFAARAEQALLAWAAAARPDCAEELLALLRQLWREHISTDAGPTGPAQPAQRARLCRLQAGEPRRPGWWHLGPAVSDADGPEDAPWPEGPWLMMDAGAGLAPDPRWLDAALQHLVPGEGRLVCQWAVAPETGDPAEWLKAALNPWTQAFWQRSADLGHQLHIEHLGGLSRQGLPCSLAQARQVRVVLSRRETSYQARSHARSMRPDLGWTPSP